MQAEFCNDGSRPLSVPGYGPFDSESQLPVKDRFASPFDSAGQLYVTAREWAVLRAINAITDERDWHQAVLQKDETRIAQWRAAAEQTASTASPPHLINDSSWSWIMLELHDKASSFESDGGVLVYDTGAKGSISGISGGFEDMPAGISGIAVFKSDAVSSNLVDDLAERTVSIHSGYDRQGRVHAVDPSMFPLIFNRTPLLIHVGETVSLSAAGNAFGKGLVITPNLGHRNVPEFSDQYQWLPCEVEFRGDDTEVEITSYINNLDPTNFRDLYSTIEKVIAHAIPAWNQVLVKGEHGQHPSRMNTFGLDFNPRRSYRLLAWHEDPELLDDDDVRKQAVADVEQLLALPEPPSSLTADNCGFDHDFNWKLQWKERSRFSDLNDTLYHKWLHLRACDQSQHPEIGQALSYDDWRAGNTAPCVVPPLFSEDTSAAMIPGYSFRKYKVNLQETFRHKGLQVFVTLSSINLTPSAPSFEDKEWNVQGLGNEHIIGVAVLPYIADNIAHDPLIRFCCPSRGRSWYDYDEYDLDQLIEVMALEKRGVHKHSDTALTACQDVGSVSMRRGRLISWPNHLRFKMGPIQLQDPNRHGHLRYLTLCLVDPSYRICSTRNVPPQQPQYWIDKALAQVTPSEKVALPPELNNHILECTESWPVSEKDAETYRDTLRPKPPPFGWEEWGDVDPDGW